MDIYTYKNKNEEFKLEIYSEPWYCKSQKNFSTFKQLENVIKSKSKRRFASLQIKTKSDKIERNYFELYKKTGVISYTNSKVEIYMNDDSLELTINKKEIIPFAFDFPNSEKLEILSKEELEYAKNFQRIFYELLESAYDSKPKYFTIGENFLEIGNKRKMYYFNPTGTLEGEYEDIKDYVNGNFWEKVLLFVNFNEKEENFEYLREANELFEPLSHFKAKKTKFELFPYKGKIKLKEGKTEIFFYRNGKIKVFENEMFLFTINPSKWEFGSFSKKNKSLKQKEMLEKILKIFNKLQQCFVHNILSETLHCLERRIEKKLPDFILKIQEQERIAKENEEKERKKEEAKPQVLKDFEKKLKEFYE